MIRRPLRSTRTDTLFPTRRSSDLNLRVLRLSGQITIPRPGANLVEKVINRRCESQRHLHVADGAFKLISIDGTNGIGGGRLRPEFGSRHDDLLGIVAVRASLRGPPPFWTASLGHASPCNFILLSPSVWGCRLH